VLDRLVYITISITWARLARLFRWKPPDAHRSQRYQPLTLLQVLGDLATSNMAETDRSHGHESHTDVFHRRL
jgi:hypothetical protein